jgi:hypothetical protein
MQYGVFTGDFCGPLDLSEKTVAWVPGRYLCTTLWTKISDPQETFHRWKYVFDSEGPSIQFPGLYDLHGCGYLGRSSHRDEQLVIDKLALFMKLCCY